jgi:hypothetical protein
MYWIAIWYIKFCLIKSWTKCINIKICMRSFMVYMCVYIYIYIYMYYCFLFFVLSFLFLFFLFSALFPVAGAANNGIRTHYLGFRVGEDISCPRNLAIVWLGIAWHMTLPNKECQPIAKMLACRVADPPLHILPGLTASLSVPCANTAHSGQTKHKPQVLRTRHIFCDMDPLSTGFRT